MSRVIFSLGSLRKSSQVHCFGAATSPVIENVQSASAVLGVGPADKTGKSRVRYWPGGRRFAAAWSRGRPWNAGGDMGVLLARADERTLRTTRGLEATEKR